MHQSSWIVNISLNKKVRFQISLWLQNAKRVSTLDNKRSFKMEQKIKMETENRTKLALMLKACFLTVTIGYQLCSLSQYLTWWKPSFSFKVHIFIQPDFNFIQIAFLIFFPHPVFPSLWVFTENGKETWWQYIMWKKEHNLKQNIVLFISKTFHLFSSNIYIYIYIWNKKGEERTRGANSPETDEDVE